MLEAIIGGILGILLGGISLYLLLLIHFYQTYRRK